MTVINLFARNITFPAPQPSATCLPQQAPVGGPIAPLFGADCFVRPPCACAPEPQETSQAAPVKRKRRKKRGLFKRIRRGIKKVGRGIKKVARGIGKVAKGVVNFGLGAVRRVADFGLGLLRAPFQSPSQLLGPPR